MRKIIFGCLILLSRLASGTPTPTDSPTQTDTATLTVTVTLTSTPTPTITLSHTCSPTDSPTPTITPTFSESPTITFSPNLSSSPTTSSTPSPTVSPTFSTVLVAVVDANYNIVRSLGPKTSPSYLTGLSISEDPFNARGSNWLTIVVSSSSGNLEFLWDGKNDQSRMVPSGTYTIYASYYTIQVTVKNLQPAAVNSLSTGSFVYPDPAPIGTATLGFVMPEPGKATLGIYNSAGTAVSQLSEHWEAGTQIWAFHTDSFAPGVYYYRLRMQCDSGNAETSHNGKFRVKR